MLRVPAWTRFDRVWRHVFQSSISPRISDVRPRSGSHPSSRGSSYVAEEEARDFIVLITNSPELQGYAGRALFRAAFESEQHSNRFQLSAVAAWVLGEYGDAVVAQSTRLQGEPSAGSPVRR